MPYCDICQKECDNSDLVSIDVGEGLTDLVCRTCALEVQDYRVFNRRMPDGSFRPISQFFDAVANEQNSAPTRM